MAQKVKPMRTDIPTSIPEVTWMCSECNKEVDLEPQTHYVKNRFGQYDLQLEYIPDSRYWNGYGPEVFCSIECSVLFLNKGNWNLHLA